MITKKSISQIKLQQSKIDKVKNYSLKVETKAASVTFDAVVITRDYTSKFDRHRSSSEYCYFFHFLETNAPTATISKSWDFR